MDKRRDVKDARLVELYIEQHETLRQIGECYGMSPAAVANRLKRAGITAKDGEWIPTNCDFCGKDLFRTRALFRKSSRHFCNIDCYTASRTNHHYVYDRHGLRLARILLRKELPLTLINSWPEGYVIHHKDHNNRNNVLSNLMVFASQSDHLAYHHKRKKVVPLWEG